MKSERLIKIRKLNKTVFNPLYMLKEFVDCRKPELAYEYPELWEYPSVFDVPLYQKIVEAIHEDKTTWDNLLRDWNDMLADYKWRTNVTKI